MMLTLSKLKEKLLSKYQKESGFYELSLPTSYPYEVSVNGPTSKELLNELGKVRAWQKEYESSKLAPFLIYKEHKARGSLGDHNVLVKVSFPNSDVLENFIAPNCCPKLDKATLALIKAHQHKTKLAYSTKAPEKVKIVASDDLIDKLGLESHFAAYLNEYDDNRDLATKALSKQKSYITQLQCQKDLAQDDDLLVVDYESLSDHEFLAQLDMARENEPLATLKSPLVDKNVRSDEIYSSFHHNDNANNKNIVDYVIAKEVLADNQVLFANTKGPLQEHERNFKYIAGSFRCFKAQLRRIQYPMYSALNNKTSALNLRNQGLNEYIKSHARLIASLGGDFLIIVQLIDYLASLEATENIFVRQISLPLMDTKFIERHYRIIDDLLTLCLPQDRNLQLLSCQSKAIFDYDKNIIPQIKRSRDFTAFLKRWGFAYKKEMVRWRMLDPKMRSDLYDVNNLMLDSTVPIDVFSKLVLSFDHVIICENEVCFLNLPPISNTIAIFGEGYKVCILASLSWLINKDIIYWGDIDTHGFNILNSFRSSLKKACLNENYVGEHHVRTMLMDLQTLNHNKHATVEEKNVIKDSLDNLQGAENECYEALINNSLGQGVRLEQELIPFDQVLKALRELLANEQILFNT